MKRKQSYFCCNFKEVKRINFFNLLTRKSFFFFHFPMVYCGKDINICFIWLLRTSTIHHRKLIFLHYVSFLHQKQRAFKMIFTELLNKVCEAKEIYAWWSVLQHLRHFQIKYICETTQRQNDEILHASLKTRNDIKK